MNVFLDSAATAPKFDEVIKATTDFYLHHNASAGRGSYQLASDASIVMEQTREMMTDFIFGNHQKYNTVFTSGATHSLNLIAHICEQLLTKSHLSNNINLVLSYAEHHSNILVWQQLKKRLEAKKSDLKVELRYLELNSNGEIRLEQLYDLIDNNTQIISLTHASNVSGKITDLNLMNQIIKKRCNEIGFERPYVCIDACQSAPHIKLEYDYLPIDFVALSAHKMYGPSGIGALGYRKELLEKLPGNNDKMMFEPIFTGGGIVELVEKDKSSFQKPPYLFEPGTPNMAGIYGLKTTLECYSKIGFERILEHEKHLTKKLWDIFINIKSDFEVTTIGNELCDYDKMLPLVSFAVKNIHPHDIGQLLDSYNIAARTGHHCAQLIHRYYQISASTRVSCSYFTTENELDIFQSCLKKSIKFFIR